MFERQSTDVTDRLIRDTRDKLSRLGILISHEYKLATKTYIIKSYDYMDEYKHKSHSIVMLELKNYSVNMIIDKLVQTKIIQHPKTMPTLRDCAGDSLSKVIDGLASLDIRSSADRGDLVHFTYKGHTIINIPKLVLHNYNYKVIVAWLEDTGVIEKYIPYYINTNDNNNCCGYLTLSTRSVYGNLVIDESINSGWDNNNNNNNNKFKIDDIYADLVSNFNEWING